LTDIIYIYIYIYKIYIIREKKLYTHTKRTLM
jgi:hypothetical protein